MAKIDRFWPKTAKREFFSKIRLEHFFSLAKMQLWAKFQKNLMRGSPDIASRTNARTDARTNERESIGPLANAERSKIVKQTSADWKKLVKNGQKPQFVTTSNVFLTKNGPKRPKENFPRHNTTVK